MLKLSVFNEGKDLLVFNAVMFDIWKSFCYVEVFVVTIVLKSKPHESKHYNDCANARFK